MDLLADIASAEGLALRRLRVRLATTEEIVASAGGRVAKPETVNYRTFRPERSGLFCEETFGAVARCACGKEPWVEAFQRDLQAGRSCGTCGGKVPLPPSRRRRFGWVQLLAPVAHPWFREPLARALGIPEGDLATVLYGERFLVTAEGAGVPRGTVVEEGTAIELAERTGHAITATGAAAVAHVLGGHPAIVSAVAVLPPHLRPLMPLGGGRWATSDVNDLYRRVINRANRHARLVELNAPEIIVRNEMRMLQEAVDALFENGRHGRAITGPDRRRLRCVGDRVGGRVRVGEVLAAIDGALASGEVTLSRPRILHRKIAALRALGLHLAVA